MNRGFSPGAAVVGLVFIGIGTLFLLDDQGVLDFDALYIFPVLLIGLGLGLIAGGRRNPG